MIVILAIVAMILVLFLLVAWSENKKATIRLDRRLSMWAHRSGKQTMMETGQLMSPWEAGNDQVRKAMFSAYSIPNFFFLSPDMLHQLQRTMLDDELSLGSLRGLPVISSPHVEGKTYYVRSYSPMPEPKESSITEEDIEAIRKLIRDSLDEILRDGNFVPNSE